MTLREPDDVEADRDVLVAERGKTDAVLEARLVNFTTGKFSLHDTHMDWLDTDFQKVIQPLFHPWVELYGFASVRGRGRFDNQTLSENRCKHVQSYIKDDPHKIQFDIFPNAKGDTWSDGDYTKDKDSGYWRAVLIKVHANKPPPKPPERTTTQFKVRLIMGTSGSVVPIPGVNTLTGMAQADDYIFRIADMVRWKAAHFHYRAIGLSTPTGLPIPLPPTTAFGAISDGWTPFHTSGDETLHSFEGAASMRQNPGVGTVGAQMYLYIQSGTLADNGDVVVPSQLEIKTEGWSMPSASETFTHGKLSMMGNIDDYPGKEGY
jgi:hypothetical protein